ncbi:hypothetical protein B0J12DRAFT_647365 [Macrophomina phaseolina]|uniref:Secreted protein n=1 Tax=Macrophomina phaseolina TaxID=35725 RepID=A0ABQ8GNH1_9PEZI|nr:hypothetical protein B0J12DRAFT_647365 [Macrophomina phaseolina]
MIRGRYWYAVGTLAASEMLTPGVSACLHRPFSTTDIIFCCPMASKFVLVLGRYSSMNEASPAWHVRSAAE